MNGNKEQTYKFLESMNSKSFHNISKYGHIRDICSAEIIGSVLITLTTHACHMPQWPWQWATLSHKEPTVVYHKLVAHL